MSRTDALIDLTGRVAIVTGAASGIGRETSDRFHALGARVIATDIDGDAVAAAHAQNTGMMTLQHDVTSEQDWDRVCEAAAAQGRLDVLVNNAGVMLAVPFREMTMSDFRKQHAINVEGPFIGMQRAAPLMIRAIAEHDARPAIVNVGSIYGAVAGMRFAADSATKAAVQMLGKAIAVELGNEGIRVNSVMPGPTLTNLFAHHPPAREADGTPVPVEVQKARMLERIPAGRFGMPADIASTIAFLASDASAYVTGTDVVINGGFTAM